MSLFDDNGPFLNTMTNYALFKVPSSRPPSEIAEVLGPVYAVGLGVVALVGGGYLIAGVFREKAKLPPPPVTQATATSTQRFADLRRIPHPLSVNEFRTLVKLHDGLVAFLGGNISQKQLNADVSFSQCDIALTRYSEMDKASKGTCAVIRDLLATVAVAPKNAGNTPRLQIDPMVQARAVRSLLHDVLMRMSEPAVAGKR